MRKRLGLRSTWFTATPGAPVAKIAATIALHARVMRNRVLLTGTAPPGTVTLQGAAHVGWRDLATHAVADDGGVAFRRRVGEASRYRLVAGRSLRPGAGHPPLGRPAARAARARA